MKRIACKRNLSLRQCFARGRKVKGGEGQLDLFPMTLADKARAAEMKLGAAINRALNRGWKATKRTIREIVKPEPKPLQLDITLRDRPDPSVTATTWINKNAGAIRDAERKNGMSAGALMGGAWIAALDRAREGKALSVAGIIESAVYSTARSIEEPVSRASGSEHSYSVSLDDCVEPSHIDDPAGLVEAMETVEGLAKQSRYCRDVLEDALAALDAGGKALIGYRGKPVAERTAERRRAEERDRQTVGQGGFDAWGFAL